MSAQKPHKPKDTIRAQYDAAWKEALDHFLQPFLEFSFCDNGVGPFADVKDQKKIGPTSTIQISYHPSVI